MDGGWLDRCADGWGGEHVGGRIGQSLGMKIEVGEAHRRARAEVLIFRGEALSVFLGQGQS